MLKPYTTILKCIMVLIAALAFYACGETQAPLDADTRIKIDSTILAQTTKARQEIDSLCKAAEQTQLPMLVDSIKKVRKKEIEAQLRTVPR